MYLHQLAILPGIPKDRENTGNTYFQPAVQPEFSIRILVFGLTN